MDNGLLCHQAVEMLNPILNAEATVPNAPGALQWLHQNGNDILEKPSMWIVVSGCCCLVCCAVWSAVLCCLRLNTALQLPNHLDTCHLGSVGAASGVHNMHRGVLMSAGW